MCQPFGGKHFRQSRKVRVSHNKHVGPEASMAQTRFRAWQLDRIDIDSDDAAAWRHPFQDSLRVTAPADRAIDGDIARTWPKAAQDFLLHDGEMHARGRSAGRKNLLQVRRVLRRIQLFVLVVKRSRIRPG